MFKLTRDDLHHKTDAELTDLFNRAAHEIIKTPRLTETFTQASIVWRMIREEIARRHREP